MDIFKTVIMSCPTNLLYDIFFIVNALGLGEIMYDFVRKGKVIGLYPYMLCNIHK